MTKCLMCDNKYDETLRVSVEAISQCCSRQCLSALTYALSKNYREAKVIKIACKNVKKVKPLNGRDGVAKSVRFYDSREWLELRYQVLKEYGRVCMLCGETKGTMNVDHIIPRSLNRNLELAFNNLQVLCRKCSIGKSNKDCTDFRHKNTS